MVSINVPAHKLDDFIIAFKYALGTLLTQEMAMKCPVDKGELKNSIRFNITDEGIEIIMAQHGIYVEFGTIPHIIRPVNAKALKFKVDGKTIFAKEVHHPGTDPQPFIRPTFHAKLGTFVQKAIYIAKETTGIS